MQALLTELTPPPVRAPVRWVALGLGGLLIAGVAAAAAFRRPEAAAPASPDLHVIAELQAKISNLETERAKLLEILTRRKADLAQLERLGAQLKAKDDQIQSLVGEIAQLRGATVKRPPPPPPPPSQVTRVTGSVDEAEHDLEGCFREWAERHPAQGSRLTVRLEVSPDGVGHSATTTGDDDSSLGLCVMDALARVHYPAGPEQLEVEVDVTFADGAIALAPRVTGHRDGPRIIDSP
jgi:uncharacterized protein YhaN